MSRVIRGKEAGAADPPAPDAELQGALASLALRALDRLLTLCPPGERLPTDELGALVRLIGQAERVVA